MIIMCFCQFFDGGYFKVLMKRFVFNKSGGSSYKSETRRFGLDILYGFIGPQICIPYDHINQIMT
jgi:hypothetical protein